MAEKKSKAGRSRTSRMSVRPVRLRRGSSGSAKSKPKPKRSRSKAKPSTGKSSAGAKGRSSGGRSRKKAPAPNMTERIEGLQGWTAEVERKQDRIIRFGGAAAILAVLAAGGALALGIINMQNGATDDDLDGLREEVNGLSSDIGQQTEQQLGALNKRIGDLQGQVKSLQQQQQQNATTISNLQQRLNRQQAAGAGGGGPGALPDALPDSLPGGQP